MKYIFIYISLIILLYSSLFSSPKWYIEVVDKTYCVGHWSSIEIDSNGYPHISYNEYNYNGELRYAHFDGFNWYWEIVDEDTGPGGNALSTSLDLNKYDYPCIAYTDYTENDEGLKYAYFDGNKWHINKVDSGYGVGNYCSIAIDSKERPHISYCDWNGKNENLKYAWFDGTKWNIEVVDSQGAVGWYSSISIDKEDHIYISYDDRTNYNLKYAYYDGSSWHIETVDNERYTGDFTSICLDSNDRPHISYDGLNDIKHAYWNGSGWVIEVIEDGEVNQYPADPSISINSKDIPCVAYVYIDKTYTPYKIYLKYAYKDNGKWNSTIVDYKDGGYTSLALDSNDYPHISYECFPFIKYAKYGYGIGIDLTSFYAKPNNDAITLNWSVSTDEDISGFNLYRRHATPTVSPVRELAPPVLTDWSGKGMPGGIAQSPANSTTTGEGTDTLIELDTSWTKVNTSLITGTSPYSYTDIYIEPETQYEYKLEAVVSDRYDTLGTTSVTSGNDTPESFNITKVYPTPASSQINIDVVIPEQSDIDIGIYDISGRRVSTIASGLYNPGEYTLTSDIIGLTNGVYIVRMTTDRFSASKNFVVAR